MDDDYLISYALHLTQLAIRLLISAWEKTEKRNAEFDKRLVKTGRHKENWR